MRACVCVSLYFDVVRHFSIRRSIRISLSFGRTLVYRIDFLHLLRTGDQLFVVPMVSFNHYVSYRKINLSLSLSIYPIDQWLILPRLHLSVLESCIMADLVDEVQLRTVGRTPSHTFWRWIVFLPSGGRSQNCFGLQGKIDAEWLNHASDESFQSDVENLYQYREELFRPQSKAPTESAKTRYKSLRTRLEQILSNYNEIEGKNNGVEVRSLTWQTF